MRDKLGPNVRRLVATRASQLIVERAHAQHGGAGVGEVAQGIVDGTLGLCLREAQTWVTTALALVRSAPGGEAWPTDEDVAGEILRKLEERKAGKK